eukprot:1019817-Amphidinium_carterae.1
MELLYGEPNNEKHNENVETLHCLQTQMTFYHQFQIYQRTSNHLQRMRERPSMTTRKRAITTANYFSTRSTKRQKENRTNLYYNAFTKTPFDKMHIANVPDFLLQDLADG